MPLTPFVFFVERAPSSARSLYRWGALREHGWDVTVLLAPDGRSMVGLGVRYEVPAQLSLLARASA